MSLDKAIAAGKEKHTEHSTSGRKGITFNIDVVVSSDTYYMRRKKFAAYSQ